jgi:single-strand DNA-binding protein
MGFQKVIIAGNIGKMELRYTAQGKAVCNFSVAVTEGFDRDHTEWFRCEAWNKSAENMNQHLQVGSYVIVEGRLKTRKWQGQNGEDKYSTELKASRVEYGPRNQGQGQRQESASRSQYGSGTGGGGGYQEPPFNPDDDIPFNCLNESRFDGDALYRTQLFKW